MSQRKFAVFDIDGTLFRWQLYHELFDALANEAFIDARAAQNVIAARERWRSRTLDYIEYETILVQTMEKAIVGLSERQFHQVADTIMQEKGHHVYRYTIDLLHTLQKNHYLIIAISGSHQQLVERFSKLHGIDIAVGRNYEKVAGKLTAKARTVAGRKHEILSEIVHDNNLSWDESYGVGDSSGDISMLERVSHPIAFNPSSGLRDEAMKRGWPIVIERKSLSYRLEKGAHGNYVLAETDPR